MPTSSIVFCFFPLLLLSEAATSSSIFRQEKLKQLEAKLQHFTSYTPPATTPKQNGRVIYPIGYGADPTGTEESSDAILNAVSDAFKVQNGSALLPGVNDLGGVVIDFQGGNFMINKPIRFPASGGGNVLVRGGTLRASDTFPGDRHLIELWSPNADSPKKTSSSNDPTNMPIFYEDITFRDILFDSRFRGGGIFIVNSARIRINNCFFLHFTTQGILVKRGHETFISGCFLGQHSTIGGDKDEKYFSGTGIELASNDNAITDAVVFSAAIGVLLSGQANLVTGVHCYNKATTFGGVGILVKAGGSLTRIQSCYLDYTGIVMEDPIQVHVTNGLFFGGANVVFKSIKGQISGTNVVDSMFSGDPEKMNPIVKLDGEFSTIDQVLIERNSVNGMSMKSTVGKMVVSGNGTKWVTNFSSLLVFPDKISHFQYSFYVKGTSGLVMHGVTNVSNNVVVVESNRAVDGIVSVNVDQYNRNGETNFLASDIIN